MFGMFKKEKNTEIISPINGTAMKLENVADKVFADKMMGDGVAIRYTGGNVYAPVTGEIVAVVPSNHAFGIKADSGVEVLVHVGLDTVNLKDGVFKTTIGMGDKVQQGDVIIEVNETLLFGSNLDLSTPVILTNGMEFDINELKITDGQEVIAKESLLYTVKSK